MKQIITDTIFEQVMEIRREGKHNMLETKTVQREAYENEFYELVLLIKENRKAYCNFILRGERDAETD